MAENLKIARGKMKKNKDKDPFVTKLRKHDLVMIKNHARKSFEPLYKGYYRIVSFKGNQVEIMPQNGGQTQLIHISDVKYVMPVDSIIQQLPDFPQLGRKTKCNLNPDHIIDLNWSLATTINTTNPITTLTTSSTVPVNSIPTIMSTQ